MAICCSWIRKVDDKLDKHPVDGDRLCFDERKGRLHLELLREQT